ncbi:TonB-dependent siderophore receptor [Pseudomonas sp. URMO17WK12:I4]|uniref:TonB-dependent siderophore receptor n=1 Tax=Pseudomonas sp. URMO17WK12:I4 TaxID=1283292 RepID=UPI000484AD7A|nr:TonB-dependent siderophore receptor [Pseudomonas sp. URMO17WK12:I4]
MNPNYKPSLLATAVMVAFSAPAAVTAQTTEITLDEAAASEGVQAQQGSQGLEIGETRIIGTAEQELKQASGVSIITADDIQRHPPANDLSEIIRRMPGVNLTGNSASGQFGNSRQIDLRGMGPENTLILIDGRPVASRNAVRMGRSGERNGRGDSNWVPAEAIERIEVLRGPAAARYGSGAAGGVVNIITKAPGKTVSGSITAYTNIPENNDEGATRRLSFNTAGPLTDNLSFRVYGNLNKTEADDAALNDDYAVGSNPAPAGREGVRNKDINTLLRWDVTQEQTLEFETGFSRQGNIYAGERAQDHASTIGNTNGLLGRETNTMYRQTAAITHRGDWDIGTSQIGISYENTRNRRMAEALAGGPETGISGQDKSTSELDNYRLHGELNLPLELGFHQTLTLGGEYVREELDDPYSNGQASSFGGITLPGFAGGARSGESEADNYAFYIEDNIEMTPDWTLTPGLRFDDNSIFGNNWSPSLNSAYKLTDTITLKGGVAKAFKAPNLYQSNPNYIYFTKGNGCPDGSGGGGGCYILGNPNLEAETSINKELGIAFDDAGWVAGLTYFHNDYKNKVVAGMGDGSDPIQVVPGAGNYAEVYQWVNAPKAIVSGWEGNLTIPLLGNQGETLSWSNNFTYMIQNKNKSTGEPLSVIPKYTVNSMLDWSVTQALDLSLIVTHYGKQEPRRLTSQGSAATGDALRARDPYTLVGLSANYELNENWRFGAGINNLFDKQIRRESIAGGEGANTYNEPGRAFYVSATTSF